MDEPRELLMRLWAEMNLAFTEGPAAALLNARTRAVLRELNERHGEELVRHQQETRAEVDA